LKNFYSVIVGKYWPFERKMVEGGYAEIEMPFDNIPAGPMEMKERWKFADLIGYLNTWSAVRAYEKALGSSPLVLVYDDMLRAWGDPASARVATWPLFIRTWRKKKNQSISLKKLPPSPAGTR
jgi:hypothetical protein